MNRSSRSSRSSRSNRPLYLALGLIVVAGAGLLAWQASRPKPGARVAAHATAAQAEGHLYGNPAAPVQILEFADFECPACEHFTTITEPDVRKRIVDAGLASFRFFDYPLPMHKNTWQASHAAACAADQGKFWEMHDALFEHQNDWNGEATSNPKKVLKQLAGQLGLNVSQWEDCFDAQRHQAQIEANQAEGERRGVNQTPTFVIGRRTVPGAIGYDALKAYVDSAAADAKSAGTASGTASGTTSGTGSDTAHRAAPTKAP